MPRQRPGRRLRRRLDRVANGLLDLEYDVKREGDSRARELYREAGAVYIDVLDAPAKRRRRDRRRLRRAESLLRESRDRLEPEPARQEQRRRRRWWWAAAPLAAALAGVIALVALREAPVEPPPDPAAAAPAPDAEAAPAPPVATSPPSTAATQVTTQQPPEPLTLPPELPAEPVIVRSPADWTAFEIGPGWDPSVAAGTDGALLVAVEGLLRVCREGQCLIGLDVVLDGYGAGPAALAVSPSGFPVAAYHSYQGQPHNRLIVCIDRECWDHHVVELGAAVNPPADVAVDRQGRAAVVYSGANGRTTYLVRCQAVDCSEPARHEVRAATGYLPSVAINGDTVLFTWYDAAARVVVVERCVDAVCSELDPDPLRIELAGEPRTVATAIAVHQGRPTVMYSAAETFGVVRCLDARCTGDSDHQRVGLEGVFADWMTATVTDAGAPIAVLAEPNGDRVYVECGGPVCATHTTHALPGEPKGDLPVITFAPGGPLVAIGSATPSPAVVAYPPTG